MRVTMNELDNIFMSYEKILRRLKLIRIKTKVGKEIFYMNLRRVIEVMISSKGVEWICRNFFKQKYLEVLEKYKMELTELYIEAGYPYDNFFGEIKMDRNVKK